MTPGTRRTLRRLVLAVALAVAWPAAAQPCPGCLQAGAAVAPLRVPEGTPLGGYGAMARRLWFPDVLRRHPHAFWFRPSRGERDPLAARALVLESAEARVAWVSADLVAVGRDFTREVERRLAAAGVRPATLIVSASHTHSGPGAYVDGALMGWLTMDRHDPEVRDAVTQAVTVAVRAADAARRPARIAAGSVDVAGLTRSRLDRALDPELVVLRVSAADGAPVAVVWNYAIHGTVLGPRNLRFSGDVTAAASRALERAVGAPALFVNGAVGDVSPARHGERAVDEMGAALAEAARRAWSGAGPPAGGALHVRRTEVRLPPPALRLANCARGWVPRALALPLGSAFPRASELVAVGVGDAAWVTVPGELQTALGARVKAVGRTRFARTFVAGVSNDYLGYLVTAADYARPTYVTCAALYGPHAGECVAAVAGGLLSRLPERRDVVTEVPARCDGETGAPS